MNLSTNFLGIKMPNPLVLASGILGVSGANLAAVCRDGCGAAVTKSIWLKFHAGHPNPTVLHLGNGNLINAVGLPHGGIEEARIEIENFRKLSKSPLFASIAASRIEEYVNTVEAVVKLKPDLIELNISCPNVEDEFGKPFACDVIQAGEVTKLAKAKCGGIPLAVKLSPNVANIAQIAKAVEAAGADAIVAINTVGPGMVIDIETAQPILANRVGGLSGPAIKPIAVKAVFDIYKAVKIPIIGVGGISSGADAIEIMQAGATLVGVGSATVNGGSKVFGKIVKEMEAWCKAHKIKNISEVIGLAHKQ
jgi:dihydroorotate dehydrogenase (NAD+) catalytic subunit